MPFSDLQGRTLASVDVRHDEIVEDVTGDTADLMGTPIMLAEERTSTMMDEWLPSKGRYAGSCTWTFYELRTVKGSVTIRWFGESNGYYSESVEFAEAPRATPGDRDTWAVAGDRAEAEGLVDGDGLPLLDAQYRAYFALGGQSMARETDHPEQR